MKGKFKNQKEHNEAVLKASRYVIKYGQPAPPDSSSDSTSDVWRSLGVFEERKYSNPRKAPDVYIMNNKVEQKGDNNNAIFQQNGIFAPAPNSSGSSPNEEKEEKVELLANLEIENGRDHLPPEAPVPSGCSAKCNLTCTIL